MAEEHNPTSYAKLFAALAKFHENLKQPSKNGNNPYLKSSYVTLEGV